ncbi:MAG: DUF4266 domain-containing protein [Myxococcales bacterium]
MKLLLVIVVALSSACVRVKPWERAKLATPAMALGVGEEGLSGEHRHRVVESRTAGGLPGDAPGGGCGCTQ